MMKQTVALIVVALMGGCIKPLTMESGLVRAGRPGPGEYRIAVVLSDDQSAYTESANAFVESAQRECETCRIDIYSMRGDKALGETLFSTLADDSPDLFYTLGIKATYLATKHISDRPVVFSSILYLQKYRDRLFAASPNLCGVASHAPMRSFFTHILMMGGGKTVGILYSPDRTAAIYEHAKKVGSTMGIAIVPIPLVDDGPRDEQLRALMRAVDTVWAIPDSKTYATEYFARLVDAALETKRPLLSYSEKFVEQGALFSVSVDYPTVGRQAAAMALDIIQQETATEDIGVVAPIGTRWVVNGETMRTLGLKIPPFVQQQFDRVIETGEE